ncbi:MAG: PQQ-like beta-propeller repeat protein [Rubripirellula sp.]|nr:PQQ-like beta-propeller repeat protein [Rubripirellula sp.]
MQTRSSLRAIATLAFFACLSYCTSIDAADNWNRFHGGGGNGDAGKGMIPSQWSDSDYSWKRDIGSRDVGSPIIIDGKVYYLAYRAEKRQMSLESLDLANGNLRWSRPFPQTEYHLHNRNTFASGTPSADEKNIFVAYAEPEHTFLKCFDHDGNELWSRDFGSWLSQHGFGTSPRIHGDSILLFNSQQAEQLRPDQTPGISRLISVDRYTGQTQWETTLTATRSCYGMPAIHQSEQGTQVINANTGDGMFALDLKTGKKLWNLEVFEKRVCSTPLIHGDIAIGTSGSGGGGNHLVAVRIPTRPGQQPEQLYRIDRGAPYVPTPSIRGNRMFMVDDKGIASCVNVETGESVWMERIGGRQGYGASPILIGDKLLVISLGGEAKVLRASDQFELLGEMDLGGPVGASPAYANGCLLLRVENELRCIGGQSI